MPIRTIFRKLRDARFRYEPLATIIVHRDSLLHNLRQFQAAASRGAAVAPVLKANAYGHGLALVAKILETGGGPLPFFCVDTYPEALVLRNEGIRTPILVIGYAPLSNIMRCRLRDVAFGVMSLAELSRLAETAAGGRIKHRPIAIHLKIDTGMHRQGILPEELDEALGIIAAASRRGDIALHGVYSHLADAGTPDSALTEKQIQRWNAAAREIKEWAAKTNVPPIRWFHLANTAGSALAENIDANAMRLGSGLYGIDQYPARALGLLPTLEMRSRITSVRRIAAGESVGYNATFTAKREMTVATIPVGYAEGLDRRLSDKGSVRMRDGTIEYPIVGRINMNITSIDVSRAAGGVKLDDEVLVISNDPLAPNSIMRMAELCGTIPYELLVHIPDRIKRIAAP